MSAGMVMSPLVRVTFVPFTSSASCPARVAEMAAVGIEVQREKASATNASASVPARIELRLPWSV